MMQKLVFGLALILSAGAISGSPRLDTATFAMGCFWCTQAQFQLLKGVKSVVAGYTGGHVARPFSGRMTRRS